jgi:hypothetical protein
VTSDRQAESLERQFNMRITIRQEIAGAVLALLLLTSSVAAAGPIYSLAGDFSLASNPNGAWSYGYYAGGLSTSSFVAFNTKQTLFGTLGV